MYSVVTCAVVVEGNCELTCSISQPLEERVVGVALHERPPERVQLPFMVSAAAAQDAKVLIYSGTVGIATPTPPRRSSPPSST